MDQLNVRTALLLREKKEQEQYWALYLCAKKQ